MMNHCRIWVRGGLGNQIFSLAAGYIAATSRGLGTRLVIDASIVQGSNDLSRRYQLAAFKLSEACPNLRLHQFLPGHNLVRKSNSLIRRLQAGILSTETFLQSNDSLSDEELYKALLNGKVNRLDGHYERLIVAMTAVEMGLGFPLQLKSPSADWAMDLEKKKSDDIGLHVRLGDFVSWRGGKYVLSGEYYRRAVLEFDERPERAKVCLYSDQPKLACEMLIASGFNANRIRFPKVTEPAEVLLSFSYHSRKVISHSTFSWWGAFWSSDGALIVSPSHPATLAALPCWIVLDV